MKDTTLDLLERAIANGDAALIVACSTPHGALAQATAVLASDAEAARDFGTPAALAAHLRALAAPQVRAARRALEEPDRPPEVELTPAAAVHAALAEQRRRGPAAAATAPATTSATATRAAAPAAAPTATPTAKLAATPTTSARLSLGEVGERLGLPRLDELPMTASLVETMRGAGLRVGRDEDGEWRADGGDVQRLANDREACDRVLLAIVNASSLRYVSGGGAVALGGRRG